MTYYENERPILADETTPRDVVMAMEEGQPKVTDAREAALKYLRVMSLVMAYLADNPTPAGIWGVCFGLGLESVVGNKTMSAVADELGVQRNTISTHARNIVTLCDLPPSPYMRSEAAVRKYKEAREGRLQ